MDIKQVLQACDVLQALAMHADGPGEDREGRARIAKALVLAETYLMEYAVHIRFGLDPYDALSATAQSAQGEDQ